MVGRPRPRCTEMSRDAASILSCAVRTSKLSCRAEVTQSSAEAGSGDSNGMSSRSGATPSTCWPTISVKRQICIIERIARIDDALFGGIVEGLRLVHVAARADAGLLARLGLVQQRAEGFALGDVGGELIGGGQDAEVGLRHPQQQTLLGALEARLGGGDLEIRFLELAEGLEAPQASATC